MHRFEQGAIAGRRARQQGFSYLVLLLALAFMSATLTVAAVIDSTAVQRQRERELLATGRQFRAAIGRYYEAGGRREYPQTLQQLVQDERFPGVRRHLRKIFVDPMTGKAEWGLIIMGGRIVGIHSLSERQPFKQDNFEPEETGLRHQNQYRDWRFTYPADMLPPLPN